MSMLSFSEGMSQYISGRTCISDGKFRALCIFAVSLAVGNGLMNGSYGAEQASEWKTVILMFGLFFAINILLIIGSYMLVPKTARVAVGWYVLIGAALMSIFACSALLIGQQYEKDNPEISIINTSIARLEVEKFNLGTSIRWRGQRMKIVDDINDLATEKLKVVAKAKKSGNYMTGATAIYHYVAAVLPFSVEAITLFFRIYWSSILCAGDIFIGSTLSSYYCPNQLRKHATHLKKLKAAQRDGERSYKEEGGWLETPEESPKDMRDEKVYQGLVRDVKSGRVGLSNDEIKRHINKGSKKTLEFLKRMKNEGIVVKEGNKWKRAA